MISKFLNTIRAQNSYCARGWTEELVNQLNSEIIILAFGVLIGIIIALVIKNDGESIK